jgi:predicted transposase YdaD
MPERWEIRLSDAFEQPIKNPEFELVVTVLNINLGKNKKLMQACKALRDYATFVQRMRERLVEMTPEEAAERTIEECIENDVLADFLKKHREEAKEMCQCLYEYDEELHIREERKIAREAGWKEGWNGGREAGWKEGQEEGRKEGRKEGQEEGRKEGRKEGQEYGVWLEKSSVIYKLLGKNYGVSKIADMLDEDEAVIQKIADVLREFAPDEYDWKNVVKDLEGTGV